MSQKVIILGAEYIIEYFERSADKRFIDGDGFCDFSSKHIGISTKPAKDDLDDVKEYLNLVLRHEIIHAFMNESGLQSNFEHPRFGQDETVVDWIAIQFPKILKVYKELEIL